MSNKAALKTLKNIKDSYQTFIRENFEFKAKDCGVCETKGACCLDAHFVNVHITRLEAEAILRTLENSGRREEILKKATATIAQYDLKDEGDTYRQTFACPLFDKEAGCLVHNEAKPAPCIGHACYENEEDLPPQFLQDRIEFKIEALNREAYGEEAKWLPLPLWLKKLEKLTK
jgi:hypothetical protein